MPDPIYTSKIPGVPQTARQQSGALNTIDQFPGMNNVERQSVIRSILNMDVTLDDKLTIRSGYALWLALPGVHSLFVAGPELLCAAQGTSSPESLYKITAGKTVSEVCPITGAGEPLHYVIDNGKVYISSRAWSGIYENGTVRPWGEELSDDIVDYVDEGSSESMMLQGVIPAPAMENLCLAAGRIFGNVGPRLYFNDPPYAYEMYRKTSFHDFPADLTMIAQADNGFYFATHDTTWFAQGHDPATWAFTVVGDGAIPGSLQYMPAYKNANNVPIWMSKTVVQVGLQGQAIPITEQTLAFGTAGRAASLFTPDNSGQYVASLPLPTDVGFGDAATAEVFRNGSLIGPNDQPTPEVIIDGGAPDSVYPDAIDGGTP